MWRNRGTTESRVILEGNLCWPCPPEYGLARGSCPVDWPPPTLTLALLVSNGSLHGHLGKNSARVDSERRRFVFLFSSRSHHLQKEQLDLALDTGKKRAVSAW